MFNDDLLLGNQGFRTLVISDTHQCAIMQSYLTHFNTINNYSQGYLYVTILNSKNLSTLYSIIWGSSQRYDIVFD